MITVEKHEWTKEELAVRRRRSVAIAIVLGVLVVLFFVTTVVRLGGNVASGV